jgi:small subunit ribosomal protein S16
VVADSRAPRDGRYIERIGSYNPITDPATIDLNVDRALYWLSVGAQPTDTARRILAYEGVLLKKHLLTGVKKGAFDEATANEKFEAWKREKIAKIQAKITRLANESDSRHKARMEAETRIKEAKAEVVAKKQAAIAAEKARLAAEARAEVEAAATEVVEAAGTVEAAGSAEVTAVIEVTAGSAEVTAAIEVTAGSAEATAAAGATEPAGTPVTE